MTRVWHLWDTLFNVCAANSIYKKHKCTYAFQTKLNATYKDIYQSLVIEELSQMFNYPHLPYESADLKFSMRSVGVKRFLSKFSQNVEKAKPHRCSLLGAWKITWLHSLDLLEFLHGQMEKPDLLYILYKSQQNTEWELFCMKSM